MAIPPFGSPPTPDATSTKKGKIKLAGALSGTADTPVVTDAALTTSDITTNDVSTTKHGFTPKAPNDTTKFLRGDATWAAAVPSTWDGWQADSTSYTFTSVPIASTSTSSGEYTITATGVDVTGWLEPGSKMKLTHGGTVKYFKVTKVAFAVDSVVTLLGAVNQADLSATALTSVSYSNIAKPFGFPSYTYNWLVRVTSTSANTQATPTSGTWYNVASLSITIPIGKWRVWWETMPGMISNAAQTDARQFTTLSTANNTESNTAFTFFWRVAGASAAIAGQLAGHREDYITLASDTTYFFNHKTTLTTMASIGFNGSVGDTKIVAESAL